MTYLLRLLKPVMLMESDPGGGDGPLPGAEPASATVDEAGAKGEPEPGDSPAPEAGDKGEPQGPDAKAQQPSKASHTAASRIQSLTGQNKALREQLAQRDAEPAAKADEPAKQQAPAKGDEIDIDAVIKGLERDDEDGTVKFRGTWVSEDLARSLLDRERAEAENAREYQSLREELARRDREAAEKDRQAEIAQNVEELHSALLERASEERASALGSVEESLTDEMRESFDSRVVGRLDQSIRQAIDAGYDVDAARIDQFVSDAVKAERAYIGLFSSAQISVNDNHRQTTKAKPGGRPGVPGPVDMAAASRQDRDSIIAARVKRAEAMMKRG